MLTACGAMNPVHVERPTDNASAGRMGLAPEAIGREILPAKRKRVRKGDAEKQVVEEKCGIRDVDRAVVVDVAGVIAGERLSGSIEQIREEKNRIGQVHRAVRIHFAPNERGPSRKKTNRLRF